MPKRRKRWRKKIDLKIHKGFKVFGKKKENGKKEKSKS
jgi:hypothetical protein